MTQATTTAPSLRLERDGAVATVIADNAPRMNAYTAAMWADLPGLIAEAAADPAIRVIILRGAGETAFSAGADISEFETARTGTTANDYNALNHAAFAAFTSPR